MPASALKVKPERLMGRNVSVSAMASNIPALALNDEEQHCLIEHGDVPVSSGKYIGWIGGRSIDDSKVF